MLPALAILALSGSLAIPSYAAFLYGVTDTDLVVIDTTDPTTVRTIAAHELASDLTPTYLTYDTESERLLGRAHRDLGGGTDFNWILVEYDLETGTATEVRDLGTWQVDGNYETFEYVEAIDSLVVGRTAPGSSLSVDLATLDPDTGAVLPLVSTGIDNDYGTYDDVRDIFYVWDGNDVGFIQTVDLDTGDLTNLAAVPELIGGGAFSEEDGGLFFYDRTDGSLVHVDTNAGAGPVTFTPLGIVPGDEVLGLAFTPVPEPAAEAALAAGAMVLSALALRRARRLP